MDVYAEQTLEGAKGILVRLIGGESYWSYGLATLQDLARRKGIALAILPADGHGAGQTLRGLCAGRSYVDLAPSLSELETRARTMLERLHAIRRSGDRQNPEIARFAALNAAVRAAAMAQAAWDLVTAGADLTDWLVDTVIDTLDTAEEM